MHVFVDRTFTGGRSNGLVQKQAVDAHPDGIIYDEPCSHYVLNKCGEGDLEDVASTINMGYNKGRQIRISM